ncbi:MAG: acyl carrier protein [Planctomycetes bacterium]|nr:acyl carrier protein [Planctomycetota bacterium]
MSNESENKPAVPERTVEEIQEWMVNYLANVLEMSTDKIDVTVPFDDFALDSATAIGMTGELEDWLGKPVDPTLVYDYPTIEQFSKCLAGDI